MILSFNYGKKTILSSKYFAELSRQHDSEHAEADTEKPESVPQLPGKMDMAALKQVETEKQTAVVPLTTNYINCSIVGISLQNAFVLISSLFLFLCVTSFP